MFTVLAALAAAVALALAVAGCGSASGGAAGSARILPAVSVALDFTPDPAHAPIYLAAADRFDRRLGVRMQIHAPGNGPDSLKLLLSGRVDIGVLDIDDLALARERGARLIGVAALVQQPLGALIAQPYIRRPRDLEGRTVGVSGLPSDPAFLRAVIGRDGGDFGRVHQLTIGFDAVAQMLAGNIAGVPAFWSDEGVTLRLRGLHVREFRINRYGAPDFPEVVLAVTPQTLRRRHAAIIRALAAIALGARRAVSDGGQAAAVIDRASGGDPRLIAAQTRALSPALLPPLTLNRRILGAYAAWTAQTRLLPRRLDVARAFDFGIAPQALRLAHLG